jgi:hypothetical protein
LIREFFYYAKSQARGTNGPLQAFYPKDKYYECRKLKKLYARTAAEITQLANTYEMYDLYSEGYQKLERKDYNQKLVQEVE